MDKNVLVLEQWYIEYYDLIYHYIHSQGCSKEEAEDLTQEVFKRARRRSQGEKNKPVEHPKRWLIKIADNVCSKHFHDTGKYEVVSDCYTSSDGEERSLIDDLASVEDDQPEVVAEKHALREEVMRYLHELPPEQRKAIELRYIKGWKLEDIATETGRALSTVGKDLRKGKEHLRVRLIHMEF